jgi:hypothetical protein
MSDEPMRRQVRDAAVQATGPAGPGDAPLPSWLALWFGVAGGQAAWGLAVLIAYPTVAAVCQAEAPRFFIHAVRWTAMVVAIAATAVAFRSWRQAEAVRAEAPEPAASRASFMGLGGMMLSATATFLLFVEDMATWVIDPCL